MPFVIAEKSVARCSILLPTEARPPVQFAAAELRRYLHRITGVEVPFGGSEAGVIRLVQPEETGVGRPYEEDDAFSVAVSAKEIVLTGHSDRAVLYAAYHLLEQCGVEFWGFGPEGEVIPEAPMLRLPEGEVSTSPAFAVRSIAVDTGTLAYPLELGWEQWIDRFYFRDFWDEKWAADIPPECVEVTNREYIKLVDWMAKHRLNSLFPSHYVAWKALAGPLVAAMADRGIMLEMPGHGLPALLPRDLFDTEPDLFCMKDGARHRGGNFCTSNPRTLEIVRKNAIRMVKAHPGLRIVHCWADDVSGGSWCHCPQCRNMPAYEQAMRAANAIADAVRERYPHLLVDFLAYHDTSVPAGNATPAPNLSLMYAPRQRCYAHPLGDPHCPRNVEYAEDFAAAAAPFGQRAQTFEYHCDNILFRNVAVPLMRTIAGDQRFYHRGGITMTQTLGFLQGSFWLYPLNYLAFAQSAWDLDADPHGFLPGYCQARFGDKHVAKLLVRWEEILRERLDLSEFSYEEYPFADWAVPPLPDIAVSPKFDPSQVIGIDVGPLLLPAEMLEAQHVLCRSVAAAAELADLLKHFRALGLAAEGEVLALELSVIQLRAFEETVWAKLAEEACSPDVAQARNEAAQAAQSQAARYVLEQVPLELRGGWMDWWAKETLGLPRP